MDDFVTIQRAAQVMGVSRWTVWRLVKDGKLPIYHSEIDRRVKLVRRADLAALMQPRPVGSREEKAAA
jgi:excisionase family DNA binding protein